MTVQQQATELRQKTELSWRIPVGAGLITRRTRMLQVLFTSVILMAVLMVFGTNNMRLAGLVAVVPLTLFMLVYARRGASAKSAEDNLRIDAAGLHWFDEFGGGTIPREQMRGFRIGLDPDTVRTIPALTLVLAGGFESQPVELYDPATPGSVRRLLSEELNLDERAVDDDQFAWQLRAALTGACDADWQRPEMRLLRYWLLEPERVAGGWLIADAPRCGQVIYRPTTVSFEIQQPGGGNFALATFDEVADFVETNVLPAGSFERQELLSGAEAQFNERENEALRRDARHKGYFLEGDGRGHLHVAGSRDGLRAFCDQFEDACRTPGDPPVGARPAIRVVGGNAMHVTIQFGDRSWIDGDTICGSAAHLRKLAAQIRDELSGAEPGAELTVHVSEHRKDPFRLRVYVKHDDFDPGRHVDA